MRFSTSRLLSLALLGACASQTACVVPVDRMIPAAQAGDLTLMVACEAMPGRGADMCRFKEGQPVATSLKTIIPIGGAVIDGELKLVWNDGVPRTIALHDTVTTIPWKEIVGGEVWTKEMRGSLLLIGQVRYKDPTGIEQVTYIQGKALVVVLQEGYDPMPVDSGYEAFKGKCSFEVAYSTAGRSVIKELSCK